MTARKNVYWLNIWAAVGLLIMLLLSLILLLAVIGGMFTQHAYAKTNFLKGDSNIDSNLQSELNCDRPPLVETTLPWPEDIHLAISQELCRRPANILPGEYQNLIATSLDLLENDTWAFATIVMRPDPMPAKYESLLDFESSLILAHKTELGWQVTFEGTQEFKQSVNTTPSTVINESSRAYFLGDMVSPSGLPPSPGLKWPWQGGQTWKYSQGPHSSGAALDFAPLSSIPETQRYVAAAASGILVRRCDDNIQSAIRLRYADNSDYSIGYLHLDVTSVPSIGSDPISQGTILGYTYNGDYKGTLPDGCRGIPNLRFWDTCGCGTAPHLHFYVKKDNQPTSIVGTVISGWTLKSDGCFHKDEATHCVKSLITSDNSLESTPPTISFTTPTKDHWYNTNETLSWTISDSGSGVDYFKWEWDDNSPDLQINSDHGSTTLGVAGQGKHILYVRAWDKSGNDTSVESRGWFGYDTLKPNSPSIDPGCDALNNQWQNTCRDPDFTWDANDRSGSDGSGVADYAYAWETASNADPSNWSSTTSYDPDPIAGYDGWNQYYLHVKSRDVAGNESSIGTFGLLYDGIVPTLTLQINNGAETANQVDVTLDLSAGDTGSGVDAVCVSNNANDCTDWQPYADVIPWTIPALNRREHTVYVWVRDKAGNEASASDTITLDLYPPKPHSASYRICDDVIDVGGGVGLTSTTYSLVSAIGQPWATGAEANASDAFGGRSGFLSSITGCLPITYAITSNYTVTQWVIASGGNLRGSASYRLGDTTGQPAASNTNAFTSTSYTLSSGFWAQITGTVPPTSTTDPTPILPTPTPSPTPGPTPTPQPGGFGVSINEGALYTNDSDVTVSVWAPNVTHLRLSNDGGFVDSHWRSYQVTSTWVISTYGSYVMPRFVYAQFRDAQNTIYGTYVDDIIYDPVAPQGQVQVLGSEFVTATLWLEAYDDNSGVSQMRIADSFEELNSALWEPYESTRSWVLDNSRVYVQFKDRAGNESLIYDSTGTAHALNSRPTGVSIQSQTSGARDTAHYFIASVSPTTVTLPLTYTWQATGQAPVTHTHQLDASDVVSFTWETAGLKVVTATAANSLGAVSNVRTINISSLTAEVSKTVTPEGQVDYGDELTYTLVISAEAGTQLSLYDPMTETTCLHFVEPLTGVDCVDNVITGTVELTPTNQVTVSFVTQVGVPGTVGWTMGVSNRACVYPVGGTVEGDCIWSNEVTNGAFRPYNIFLPLVLRQ